MRHLNCAECGKGKETGVRMLYAGSPIGEPPEYERVTWGIAKQPTQEQRTIRVNGEPIAMNIAAFNCDGVAGRTARTTDLGAGILTEGTAVR